MSGPHPIGLRGKETTANEEATITANKRSETHAALLFRSEASLHGDLFSLAPSTPWCPLHFSFFFSAEDTSWQWTFRIPRPHTLLRNPNECHERNMLGTQCWNFCFTLISAYPFPPNKRRGGNKSDTRPVWHCMERGRVNVATLKGVAFGISRTITKRMDLTSGSSLGFVFVRTTVATLNPVAIVKMEQKKSVRRATLVRKKGVSMEAPLFEEDMRRIVLSCHFALDVPCDKE